MLYSKYMENYLNQITTNSKLNESSDINDLRILRGTNCSSEHFYAIF